MTEKAEHRAIVQADPDNPQMHRAWCPACGWRAKRADYGMADAWRRATVHNQRAGASTPPGKTKTTYERPCPRCGAEPGEPCWNLRTREPNAWPHRERVVPPEQPAN